jgi:CheY-like chemotaxis protein
VIDSSISFARDAATRGVSALEDLDQALTAVERAAELTSHLLAVGRRKRVNPTRVDLAQLVESNIPMLRRAVPESVAFQFEAPRARCMVQLDPPQFERVLLNLCLNARDAMPEGGTLRVSIEPDAEDAVVLSVSDEGAGIVEADLARIFDPFFSTKDTGTGMGLAVAAGIVSAHGGTIIAESERGRGTTMKVRLPRASDDEPPRRATPVPPAGAGLVLIAEDEPLVRAQIVRMLESGGYSVLQAENGAQALELYREHQSEVSAVVLDVLMPVLDGWQTFVELERIDPEVRVLLSTGYGGEALPADFAKRGVRKLSKPYKASALLNEIGELLKG